MLSCGTSISGIALQLTRVKNRLDPPFVPLTEKGVGESVIVLGEVMQEQKVQIDQIYSCVRMGVKGITEYMLLTRRVGVNKTGERMEWFSVKD